MVPALRVLLLAVMVLSIGSALSNFFTLKLGRPEVSLLSASCAAAMCVGVSWVLVPRVGMIGAATATALAYLVGQAVQVVFFIKTSQLSLAGLFLPTRDDVRSVVAMAKATARDIRLRKPSINAPYR
jgi:Na+-driven multidrug efflux pump